MNDERMDFCIFNVAPTYYLLQNDYFSGIDIRFGNEYFFDAIELTQPDAVRNKTTG
jgi:hypothetical protein